MRRTAALIAGGGPAGSAAAISLARAGILPLLIERDTGAGDAICGGFLSWRTLETLAALGIDGAALGGEAITRLRVIAGDDTAEAALPAAAIGLSRRTLDRALLAAAARAGAGIECGVAIAAFDPDGGAPAIRLRDGARIVADRMILATGKHDLRGIARPRPIRGEDRMAGVRVRIDPSPALRARLRGTIELHLFAGGYAGLLLQEDGRANLCMAVRGSRLAAAGGPRALLADLAGESARLGEWIGRAPPSIDAIAQLPYGWRAKTGGAAVFRVGDQAGVISSLAGEGIGIALATGIAAADAVARGDSGLAYQAATARRLQRPLAVADAIKAIGERPAGAGALIPLLRLAPALAAIAARWTRIPPR